MRTNSAFWDTSGSIPLCVFQDATKDARQARRKFSTCVIWWGAAVEVNSALARLKRGGFLQTTAYTVAASKLAAFQRPARVIRPSNKMLDLAADLPERFGLRSLDAFQLASALVWCSERPRNRSFVCADRRLGDAASNAGFDVVALWYEVTPTANRYS